MVAELKCESTESLKTGRWRFKLDENFHHTTPPPAPSRGCAKLYTLKIVIYVKDALLLVIFWIKVLYALSKQDICHMMG